MLIFRTFYKWQFYLQEKVFCFYSICGLFKINHSVFSNIYINIDICDIPYNSQVDLT